MTKTYAAFGYIEYEIALKIGGNDFRANFSGGSITQYGITPATYTTSNPVVQYAIEQMASYKSGRITLYRVTGDTPAATTEAEAKEAPVKAEDVSVATIEDAVNYLNERYNIPRRQLRTRESVERMAKAQGVNLTIEEP